MDGDYDAPASVRYGRYERLFGLASGGMARVYVARLSGEGGFARLVALKQMHDHLADDEVFVRMFLDEARLAANISSAHVVPTLDLGRTDTGELYLVMELVVGLSLSSLISSLHADQRRVPLPIAVEVLAQAATGLHDAHGAVGLDGEPLGIVHRDVSPHNVLVGVDGRVRLSDFGVARAVHRLTTTSDGRLKGKYAYCSPEQARGESLDCRSDVFALGIVAWEILTGERLFRSDSPLAILERIVSEPVPLATERVASVPEELSAVVARALEKAPEDRFATAGELASMLREVGRFLPERSEAAAIGQFVSEVGGEGLASLQAKIRAVSAEPSAANALAPTLREPTGSAAGTLSLDASAGSGEGQPPSGTESLPEGSSEATSAADRGGTQASPGVGTVDAADRQVLFEPSTPDGQTDFGAATGATPTKRSRRGAFMVGVALVAAAAWLVLAEGDEPATSVDSAASTPASATGEPDSSAPPGSRSAASPSPTPSASSPARTASAASAPATARPSAQPPATGNRPTPPTEGPPRPHRPPSPSATNPPRPPPAPSTPPDELLPVDALDP